MTQNSVLSTETRVFLNKTLKQDELYHPNEIVKVAERFEMPTRIGMEKAIISNGKIVNVVSNKYGHLPNEKFFLEAERKLIDKDINYAMRTINRDDCSFSAEYILKDERYHVNVKNGKDVLTPMIKLVNSYDGTCKTMGYFGFYRQVCQNGLNVSRLNIGFGVKHKGDIVEMVMPELDKLINIFMENEFYSLHRKFEVLAEKPITNLQDFVKLITKESGLFKYEASDKNPEPSLNARLVAETITSEANLLQIEPNYWLGYNAFNELLHGKMKKTFEKQRDLDGQLFDAVLNAAGAN